MQRPVSAQCLYSTPPNLDSKIATYVSPPGDPRARGRPGWVLGALVTASDPQTTAQAALGPRQGPRWTPA